MSVIARGVLTALCALYVVMLGALPLVGPDEPRYAQVAREMMTRGDFVTPTLGGHTWFEKPVLPYWMMRFGYGVFGITETGARFGSALAGLTTIAALAWMAYTARAKPVQAGDNVTSSHLPHPLTLALAAASTLGLIVFARAASFDIYLTATVAVAVSCFYTVETSEHKKRQILYAALCYGAMGCGLLAKGLVGVILPGGIFVCYLAFRKGDVRRLWWTSLMWGWAVTLLIAAVWYAPVINRHGWVFVDEFFIQHHFARYTSNKYRHPQPVYFYVPVMLALALPYSLVLLGSLTRVWRDVLRVWRTKTSFVTSTKTFVANPHEVNGERLRVLGFAWLLFPVLFFSVSGSKLPGYVLPALPGAAVLIAARLTELAGRGDGRRARCLMLTGVLMIALAASVTAAAINLKIINTALALMIWCVVTAGGVAVIKSGRDAVRCLIIIAATVGIAVTLILSGGTQQASVQYSLSAQLSEAARRGYADVPFAAFYALDRTAEFYASGRVVYDADGEPVKCHHLNDVKALVARHGTVLFSTDRTGLEELTASPDLKIDIIGSNAEVTLVAVKSF